MVSTAVIAGAAVGGLVFVVLAYYVYMRYNKPAAHGDKHAPMSKHSSKHSSKNDEDSAPAAEEGGEVEVGMWPFSRAKNATKANVAVGFKVAIV